MAAALGHAPDNISATLPDVVRDRVDSKDRRERAEHATDAGARASNFKLPKEAAKAVEDRTAQARDAVKAHDESRGASKPKAPGVEKVRLLNENRRGSGRLTCTSGHLAFPGEVGH